jgi:hypothetical protein
MSNSIVSRVCILNAAVLLILCSCCTSGTITPQDQNSPLIILSPISDTFDNPDDHLLMGIWDADFNIHDNSVIVTPNRETATHFPITSLIPLPTLHINSIAGEILDVDVTIQNPYPLDVYDVRLIIYTDPIGHMLLNADDWTPLFDIPGGLPINPFKAFMKSDPNRKFPGMTEQIVNCLITVPGNNFSIRFALEASYPGNCEEPYEIKDFSQGVLYNQVGSSSNAAITVLDWQTDTSNVYLYCPDLAGSDFIPFTQVTQENWQVELVNETGAPVGSYQAFIIAFSSNSGNVYLADRVMIQVTSSIVGGWARSWGSESCDKALAVTSDSQNNILVTGYFFDSVDFDPGPGTDIHYSNGGDDIFLSKFDHEGNLIWAKTWGSPSDDRNGLMVDGFCHLYGFDPSRGIVTDINNNIYLTGSFRDTCDFDPGPGIDEHISNGGCDIYLARFNADGNFTWARTWGGQRTDAFFESGADIALGLKQDIYVSGYFSNTVDFDPGAGEDWHTPINEGGGGSFVSKFDIDGNFVWARTWGGQKLSFDIGYGVECVKGGEGSGDVLVAGTFRGVNIDFDPGNGVDLHSSVPSTHLDAYLSRFDENGNFQWARTWSDAREVFAYDLALDLSGYTYVVGSFCGSGDFDPGPEQFILSSTYPTSYDSYVSKFDSTGDFILGFSWGQESDDHSTNISIDNTGNQYIYVTTMYSGDIDLDPGPEEDVHAFNGIVGSDNALSEFDLNGNYIWGRSWSGPEYDFIRGVCIDSDGNIYVSGNHYGIADFNPGSGIDNHESNGESDAFLIKFLPNGYWE